MNEVFVSLTDFIDMVPEITWVSDNDGGYIKIRMGYLILSIPMNYIQAHQEEFNKLADYISEKPTERTEQ